MTKRDSGKGPTPRIAQRPEADEFLARGPPAALVGMLLDQRAPMERAFTGPYTLAGRAEPLTEVRAYEQAAKAAAKAAKSSPRK